MSASELIGAGTGSGFLVAVDGVECQAYEGDSLAAVMVRAGRLSWRTTRGDARPRGLFCGIGACHDCLVVVNGVASVRACLDPARPGDRVETQEGSGRGDLGV